MRLQHQVKKGQMCAKIDPRPYQTVVDQDKANLSVARRNSRRIRPTSNTPSSITTAI